MGNLGDCHVTYQFPQLFFKIIHMAYFSGPFNENLAMLLSWSFFLMHDRNENICRKRLVAFH